MRLYRSTNVVWRGSWSPRSLAASLSAGGWSDESQATAKARIVDDAAMADETSGDNWLAYGRTYSEQRFSPLDADQRRRPSAGSRPTGSLELPTDRGLVSTPLVVDGVLYFIGSMNVVRAVDATTGTLLWEYDPEVRARGRPDARRLGSQPRHRLLEGQGLRGHLGRPPDRDRRADRQGSVARADGRCRTSRSTSPARRRSSRARCSSATAAPSTARRAAT